MAEKIGGVYIEIQAKMGSLEADLKRLEARMQQTNNSASGMSSTFSGMGKYLAAGAIATGLYQVGKAALSAAAQMESNKIALTTMLGSAEKAKQLLKDMTEFAASTPFDLPGVVDAGKRMLAFGFTADEIIPKLRQIGDVASGLSQPIGDMVYLFGQIKTQGKAMTQDLNQFANRGVPIFDEVAKAMGVPKEAVRKLAEEGKITYNVIAKAFDNMTKEGSKFGGLMEAQAQSLGGKWSNFQDNLGKAATILGNEMAPVAKDLLDIGTQLLSKFTAKDMPDSITMTGSIIKDVNALLNGTKDHIDQIVEAMGETESDALYQNVVNTERTADGVAGHFEEILGYFDKTTGQYENLNGAAAMYVAYTSGDIKLKQEQISKLERLLALGKEMTKEAQSVNAIRMSLGDAYADVVEKAYEAQKKTEAKDKANPDPGKWKQQKKAAQDLIDTINKDYVNALGTVDQKIDLQLDALQKQYDEVANKYKKNLIDYKQYEESKDKINEQYAALQRARFLANLEAMMNKYNQAAGGLTQLSGQLSQLVTMSASNQTAEIDNKLTKQLEAIDIAYQKEVEGINNSVMSQKEKDAALKALDEQKARDEKAAQAKAEKEKRRIARDTAKIQKQISIFETVVTTPTAAMQAYKAMAGIPIVGPALGAIAAAAATALGIAKIKLIKDQPLPALAQGGIIPASPQGTQFIAGEAGSSEAVIPLNSQGINILKQALQGSASERAVYLNVYINDDYNGLYRASRDGRVMIDKRAIV